MKRRLAMKGNNEEATSKNASGPQRNCDIPVVPCPGTPREEKVELTSRDKAIDPNDRGSSRAGNAVTEPKDHSVIICESDDEIEMLEIEEDGDAVMGGETWTTH